MAAMIFTMSRSPEAAKSERGFSMLQLLTAVMIAATLAAIATPGMARRVNESRRVEGRIALATISRMQDAFYQARGRYAATLDELGFGRDKGLRQGARYAISLTALDNAGAYVATAVANLDGDRIEDLLVVARGGGHRGAVAVATDDITNLSAAFSLCYAAGTNDQNGDGNGNNGRSGRSNDRNGDGNGNAGQGGGGRQTCFSL
jgi:type IV pilus assembly protein PilE